MIDYIEMLGMDRQEVIPYAANNSLGFENFNSLHLTFPFPDLKNQLEDPKIWIGAAGTSTPLHMDSCDNFCYHLLGSKKWIIFSIRDCEYLYLERNSYGTSANPLSEFSTSRLNIDYPDHETFPLFKHAAAFELTLEAGELLYLPYGWAHSVKNLTTSAMINIWFRLDGYIPLLLRKTK
ncbi:cupin-like domain-containing protein [Dyadobacter luticola]|nr:cupin-like domain-containing protein [Dyadobacter luticola]